VRRRRAKKAKPMMLSSFGISNIAWPGEVLDDALDRAVARGLDAIEIAPYWTFGRWDVADATVDALSSRLKAHGLRCSALQGILYKADNAALFASEASRAALADHLKGVARLAGRLGAKACVLGAPRQRDPGALSASEARAIAVSFFREIGPRFAAEGAPLAIEANARHYACRFLTTTAEAIDFVEEVATNGIGLQIDTGTLFLEHEDSAILMRAAHVAVHAHISEPDLSPLGTSGVDHRPIADAFAASGYAGSLSIEMKATENWPSAFDAAIKLVRDFYSPVTPQLMNSSASAD
jgi:sugar phosphate isomerase/epimerase